MIKTLLQEENDILAKNGDFLAEIVNTSVENIKGRNQNLSNEDIKAIQDYALSTIRVAYEV